jgi:hypothetical protein
MNDFFFFFRESKACETFRNFLMLTHSHCAFIGYNFNQIHLCVFEFEFNSVTNWKAELCDLQLTGPQFGSLGVAETELHFL